MPEKPTRKQNRLHQAGLLHPQPERVQEPLFLKFPQFFDPQDQLQVRYEMLRSHLVDHHHVVGICQRYGISRQTFYNLQERFLSEGTAGLLAKKPGPRGPSKMTAQVLQFVEQQFQHDPHLSATSLLAELEARFDVSFHKRILEKLLKELPSRKNPEPAPPNRRRRVALNDIAATRYEVLRREFLTPGRHGIHEDWMHFSSFGFVGLLPSQLVTEYVVEVHRAPVRRWWGRIDPKEQTLLEVFRWLTGNTPLAHPDPGGHRDERRFVCACLDKDQQKHGTIASQLEALRTYATAQGVDITEDYVCRDVGYSGALLARPGLDRLRDGAQAGAFDAILVLSPDRLSRKYAYLILILEEFERLGVRVTFLEQPPGDDPHSALLVQIQGAVAEYERTKLAERYRRGKLYRARQGEVFWNAIPYGYRRVPRRDGVPAHLVIDEAQAEVVRNIFTWHAYEDMTIRQITKRLTRESYPTPKGGAQWGETTVHRILRREAYLGTLYYNQSVWVCATEDGGGRRKRGLRPSSEWIAISIPPLIDRGTFERSLARHGPNQQFSPRNLHQERWLLRRLVRCEKCGLKCACVSARRPLAPYYRCDKQERVIGRPRCRPNHIRAEALDELVCERYDAISWSRNSS